MSTNPFATPGSNEGQNSANPFGTPPPAPEFEGLSKDDAERGTTVILEIREVTQVTSKFPDPKTGEFKQQDRLTADVTVVDGPKAGKFYPDQWIFWSRVVAQFKSSAGDGEKYLVKLGMEGRAVSTTPVTDQAVIQKATALL